MIRLCWLYSLSCKAFSNARLFRFFAPDYYRARIVSASAGEGNRRIPDKATLTKQVAAWQHKRNKHHVKADWQFKTDDARVKLKRKRYGLVTG